MKRKIAFLLFAAFILQAVTAAAEPADIDESKVFDLDNESTGYRICFPHFVGIETRTLRDGDRAFEAPVVILDAPDGEDDVFLFEVLSDDADARFIEIVIRNRDGLVKDAEREDFAGTHGVYERRGVFESAYTNEWMHADIYVYDDGGEPLWHFYDIYFIFEDDAANGQAGQGAAAPATPVIARPTASKVLVDGNTVDFEAYVINGNNYFKLRDLAMALNGTGKQFEVKWDGARKTISLLSGEPYTPVGGELAVSKNPATRKATPTSSKIDVDGEERRLTAYTIGGNNYFRLRDIAEVFNIGVTWDSKTNTIGLDTKPTDQG